MADVDPMAEPARPLPGLAPFVMTTDADAVVAFAQAAFGAELAGPPLRRANGAIWNAELKVAGGTLFLSTVTDPAQAMPAFLHLYVEDADATHRRAIAAGGREMMPVADQFWGDRAGGVIDPTGNIWWIATRVEDVAGDELERRARAHEAARGA